MRDSVGMNVEEVDLHGREREEKQKGKGKKRKKEKNCGFLIVS